MFNKQHNMKSLMIFFLNQMMIIYNMILYIKKIIDKFKVIIIF